MSEIVSRFPEVENFITILDWGEKCRKAVGEETYVESNVQRKVVWWCWGAESVCELPFLPNFLDRPAYRDFVRGALAD